MKGQMTKKSGILVVSFGTGCSDSRKKSIEVLEQEIAAAYPMVAVERAWTSSRLRRQAELQEGLRIHDMSSAMKAMAAEGVTHMAVLPTCIIPGIEYDIILEEAGAHEGLFSRMLVGEPLLMRETDCETAACRAMEDYNSFGQGEALVWFGHGTSHGANRIYRQLDQAFCRQNRQKAVRLATMKAEPRLEEILEWLGERSIRRIHLAPFMVAAGGHVCKEMAGEREDSWRRRLIQAGYQVECHIRGLGENPGIRRMYLEGLHRVMEGLECKERLR